MSAHEDQISNNRRRLFKALSAAPVVMTLRPGSALANSSAYQCLNTTTPQNNLFHETTGATCSGGADVCFAYREKRYWVASNGTPTKQVGQCGALATATIVETRAGVYVTLDGTPVSPTRVNIAPSGALELRSADGLTACITGIPPQQGLFLLVGEPLLDAGNNAIGFLETGVYPERQLVANQQGITGTCLASIGGNITGYTIARG